MKIRIIQFNPTIGSIEENTASIIEIYKKALEEKAGLVIFPELAVCGYPPMDLLERKRFIDSIQEANERIRQNTADTAILFGTVTRNEGRSGRPVYNAALLMKNGELMQEVHKTLLPTYDVFDEFRYFEPNKVFETVQLNGLSLGITICEDIWNNENEIVYHTYNLAPADELVKRGAEILINISASPFTIHKPELRAQMLQNHVRRLGCPLVYANQTGANTELIFDGDSMFVGKNGEILLRAPLFEECYIDIDSSSLNTNGSKQLSHSELPCREERIFRALVIGVKDYLAKTGFSSTALLGLSGGIDSALVAVVAAEALGPQNVFAVTMPSEFSSEGSVNDSVLLAERLGIKLDSISIKEIYDVFVSKLEPQFKNTPFGVAEENIQSRSRGLLLMALSNKFGHILLNTGNKSEMAVGYCTLYGDMAGGISVLSDVYKTDVYAVCRWLNQHWYKKEVIPEAIISKPPSAELRPDQKDSDSLPDYDFLDDVLTKYIEQQQSARELLMTYDPEHHETIRRICRLVDMNEYKRRQAAPGLRVSPKAFGSGRRLPIVQRWTSQQE
ncbi:MAG: NAD+ synthase [Balneolales bacterium]|nr:NAD+ synthase [Balneolales bacterium]